MGFRESLSQKPRFAFGVVGGILFIAIVLIALQLRGGSGDTLGSHGNAFFSDDDGASFFRDASTKAVPFDHNGKPAARAYVYSVPGGSPFVGYLERPATQQEIAANGKSSSAIPVPMSGMTTPSSMVVKKPGAAAKWAIQNSKAGVLAMNVTAPGGAGKPQLVQP